MRANNVRAILSSKETMLERVPDTSMDFRRVRRELQCEIMVLRAIAEVIEHAGRGE